MQLRPYQEDAVFKGLEVILKSRTCLICAPTGSGKTEIMIQMIKDLSPSTFLILTKRIKLIDQTAKRFGSAGITASVFCASLKQKEISDVTVASIDSVHAIAQDYNFDYVIFDEVHNLSDDPESRFNSTVSALMEAGSKLIGFTATPYRRSGLIYGEGKFFKKIDFEIKFKGLIDDGYLVVPILKETKSQFNTSKLRIVAGDFSEQDLAILADNQPLMRVQVLEALTRLEGRRKIFWQCANIKHAEAVFERLKVCGEEAVVVHSKQDNVDSIKAFEVGHTRHCVFVSILSEGYDFPQADALVMLRPTRSSTLYVQTVGRVLRPYQGKKDALILDFGEVVKNCGPIDKPVIVSGRRAKRKEGEILVWTCPSCLTYNSLELTSCMDCDYERVNQVKKGPKLLDKPDEEASVLYGVTKEPDKWIKNVRSIYVQNHKAKSGKDCYMVSTTVYGKPGVLSDIEVIKTYYRKDLAWHRTKAETLCEALGVDMEAVNQGKITPANNLPQKAKIVLDGDYKKIQSVIFGEGD